MAIVAAAFQFPNPFPCSISKHQQSKFSSSSSSSSSSSFTTKAIDNPESNNPPTTTTDSNPKPPESSSDSNSFEKRLENVRYKSGTGKKAEARKARKSKKSSSSSGGNGNGNGNGKGNVFLPPVPLKEPVSGGMKVEFGFNQYTERINGRIAGLGLAALLLVELGTGKSVVNYHSGSIVFIQIYFVAAVTAVYIKFEKEKISVWPQ